MENVGEEKDNYVVVAVTWDLRKSGLHSSLVFDMLGYFR